MSLSLPHSFKKPGEYLRLINIPLVFFLDVFSKGHHFQQPRFGRFFRGNRWKKATKKAVFTPLLLLCLNCIIVGFRQRALDIAGAQAASADIHPLASPIDHNMNTLHIGCPFCVGLAVGMADQIAVQLAFSADLTKLAHDHSPPRWSQDTSKRMYSIMRAPKLQEENSLYPAFLHSARAAQTSPLVSQACPWKRMRKQVMRTHQSICMATQMPTSPMPQAMERM